MKTRVIALSIFLLCVLSSCGPSAKDSETTYVVQVKYSDNTLDTLTITTSWPLQLCAKEYQSTLQAGWTTYASNVKRFTILSRK